ncbi:hypothetical protein [Methylosinus sp. Ce-a6]|uniref:hypothetical protein n=1 Tax=Methylosinus sp. Ce-a6 TaxID=2172005 RepID=UPI0013592DB2|nr:hypothetical protein [Methylosinus sp. Ce-a6]
MPIATEQLEAIDATLATAAADQAAVSALKQVAPGLSAMRCDKADIQDETPFRSYEKCDLFLIDGRDHCVKITSDPSIATGLVVAPKR